MAKKCKPRQYYTVSGKNLRYGFRCKHILSATFHTEESMLAALKKHRKESKHL